MSAGAARPGPYPSFDGVRLVLLESPANPGLDVCDIAALADGRARGRRAGRGRQHHGDAARPDARWTLGADLVVASGTKALTGHSDLLLGYVAHADPSAARRRCAPGATRTGGIPGNFDAWLAHRSLATLDLRLGRQTENAAAVAAAAGRASGGAVGALARAARRSVLRGRYASRCAAIPGVVTFELDSAEAVAGFLTASTPGDCRPRRSAACTPRPTGGPSGATTRRPAWSGSPAASRTRPTWSPTSPRALGSSAADGSVSASVTAGR